MTMNGMREIITSKTKVRDCDVRWILYDRVRAKLLARIPA